MRDWLTQRGPIAICFRIYDQLTRIITGAPLMRFSRITPHLYVGGQYRARGWDRLQQEGITAVVNLRSEFDDATAGIAPERYLYLPTPDNNPPSLENIQAGVDFIAKEIEQHGKVYIHCGVGVGRAPTMAAAYLVYIGMTPPEAWNIIRAARPFIWPLPGQLNRITQYAFLIRGNQRSSAGAPQ